MTSARFLPALLAALAACSDGGPPPPAPKAASPRPLSGDDWARLQKQESEVLRLLRARYGSEVSLTRSKADLALLQRLLDDQAVKASETWRLQCLGVVLGQVFANETKLRWVIVEDEYGRDPALEYPDTSIRIYPLTLISKRVEEAEPGETVDVEELFRRVKNRVDELRKDPEVR